MLLIMSNIAVFIFMPALLGNLVFIITVSHAYCGSYTILYILYFFQIKAHVLPSLIFHILLLLHNTILCNNDIASVET
jgi:hypothetical protein